MATYRQLIFPTGIAVDRDFGIGSLKIRTPSPIGAALKIVQGANHALAERRVVSQRMEKLQGQQGRRIAG
ncbi:hypothetical protein C8N35_1129 [Breoghania corrubedonensis]|uniref:Uncharacterized protein n=1 Tax=Breoghania corrubedonensis TaxID=665038 RepID=A0A2T5UVY9_9HYPH|nr:hypothetical protein C8N35_1129 [Breoghania corrubedonensis]